MISTWLITSELANQRARKVLFTCVVYTSNKYWQDSMYTNEDITIKANIKQNYLEVYSQRKKIQIKEKDSPVLPCASLRRIILRVISAHIRKWRLFSLRLDLAKKVNRHFLENDYGDLSFFFSVVLN